MHTESEIEIKPGMRVHIDNLNYTVKRLTEKGDSWELVGYIFSRAVSTRGKEILIRKTSAEIRELVALRHADEVLSLPFPKPPKRRRISRGELTARLIAGRRRMTVQTA